MGASYKVKYQERAEMLEEVVGGRLRPYMLELLDKMRRVQVKDEPMVKQLISWIEKYEWMNYVDLLLDSVISTLSKSYLACFTEFYGKPDFNGISAVFLKDSPSLSNSSRRPCFCSTLPSLGNVQSRFNE